MYKVTIKRCSNYLMGRLRKQFHNVEVETIKNNNHTVIIKCDSMTKNEILAMFRYDKWINPLVEEIKF